MINDISEVSQRLQNNLRRYNDEFNEGLDLMVSSHVMYHVVRLHRILSYKNRYDRHGDIVIVSYVAMLTYLICIGLCRGNALLVGAIGTHLASLARLALYMLDYHIHPIDCSYPNSFLDGLRAAVRQAGCDGKTTTILFTVGVLVIYCYHYHYLLIYFVCSRRQTLKTILTLMH